jgi:rare lipoprotein A
MRRVAGVFPLKVHPATFVAALAVAAVWVLAALYVADRIVSSEEPAPPRSLTIAPEPSQIPNRAKKAAREAFKKEAQLAPEITTPEPEIVTPMPEEDGEEQDAPAETGHASWYDLASKTASGEAMDADALTAAHPSLPLGSHVRVANLDNGREVVVRINDRGPFAKDRIIDLSKAAAETIGMVEAGVARVSVSLVESVVASSEQASEAPPIRR